MLGGENISHVQETYTQSKELLTLHVDFHHSEGTGLGHVATFTSLHCPAQ